MGLSRTIDPVWIPIERTDDRVNGGTDTLVLTWMVVGCTITCTLLNLDPAIRYRAIFG